MTERERRLERQLVAAVGLAERQQAELDRLTKATRRLAGQYGALQARLVADRRARGVEEHAANVFLGAALDLLAEQAERT
jgi:hypothetical protein